MCAVAASSSLANCVYLRATTVCCVNCSPSALVLLLMAFPRRADSASTPCYSTGFCLSVARQLTSLEVSLPDATKLACAKCINFRINVVASSQGRQRQRFCQSARRTWKLFQKERAHAQTHTKCLAGYSNLVVVVVVVFICMSCLCACSMAVKYTAKAPLNQHDSGSDVS